MPSGGAGSLGGRDRRVPRRGRVPRSVFQRSPPYERPPKPTPAVRRSVTTSSGPGSRASPSGSCAGAPVDRRMENVEIGGRRTRCKLAESRVTRASANRRTRTRYRVNVCVLLFVRHKRPGGVYEVSVGFAPIFGPRKSGAGVKIRHGETVSGKNFYSFAKSSGHEAAIRLCLIRWTSVVASLQGSLCGTGYMARATLAGLRLVRPARRWRHACWTVMAGWRPSGSFRHYVPTWSTKTAAARRPIADWRRPRPAKATHRSHGNGMVRASGTIWPSGWRKKRKKERVTGRRRARPACLLAGGFESGCRSRFSVLAIRDIECNPLRARASLHVLMSAGKWNYCWVHSKAISRPGMGEPARKAARGDAALRESGSMLIKAGRRQVADGRAGWRRA